jgi:hypothetical protein
MALYYRMRVRDSAMPDRELGDELKERLAAALTSGAPPVAPLPSQARYAMLSSFQPRGHLRSRLISLAAAAAAVVVLAGLAGPPQSRQFVIQSVGNIARDLGVPSGPATASPSPIHPTPSEEPSPSERPGSGEATPSPEPNESPSTRPSPEPAESPEPRQSPKPSPGDDHPPASPSPGSSPSPGDH